MKNASVVVSVILRLIFIRRLKLRYLENQIYFDSSVLKIYIILSYSYLWNHNQVFSGLVFRRRGNGWGCIAIVIVHIGKCLINNFLLSEIKNKTGQVRVGFTHEGQRFFKLRLKESAVEDCLKEEKYWRTKVFGLL